CSQDQPLRPTSPHRTVKRISCWSTKEAPDLSRAWAGNAPRRTRIFRLEDDRPEAKFSLVHEYDFTFEFDFVPEELAPGLESCLRMACAQPDSVAWLAFEGSFHFGNLLTDSIVNHIYGACATGDSPLVVLDDEPVARAALVDRLRDYRARLDLD
ncbi:hypothetical protein, partial [Micromonospora sp. DT233]|uniref:hypothetical protein n=1 Tax=Micromonospora sp. DT233 TaxID=3393432 RepID=UPI003CEAFAA9